MADWAISSMISKLTGYLGVDGVILPDKEQLAQDAIDQINGYSGLNLSIDENNRVSLDGTSYTSADDLTAAVEADFSEYSDLSGYFYDHDYEIGILSDTGGTELAKRILSACGVSLTYTYSSEEHLHSLTCDYFNIYIIEGYTDNNTFVYPRIVVEAKPSASMSQWIDILNTSEMEGTGKRYVYYYIFKGAGDFFIKTVSLATNDQLPDPDDAEEFFKDVTMCRYYYNSDSEKVEPMVYGTDIYGGFAVVAMIHWEEDTSDDGGFDFVLMSYNNAPLLVGRSLVTKFFREKYLMPLSIKQSLTNSTEATTALAPIYAPTGGLYSSRYSYWGLIAAYDDVYDLLIGFSRYRYDHGFCLAR